MSRLQGPLSSVANSYCIYGLWGRRRGHHRCVGKRTKRFLSDDFFDSFLGRFLFWTRSKYGVFFFPICCFPQSIPSFSNQKLKKKKKQPNPSVPNSDRLGLKDAIQSDSHGHWRGCAVFNRVWGEGDPVDGGPLNPVLLQNLFTLNLTRIQKTFKGFGSTHAPRYRWMATVLRRLWVDNPWIGCSRFYSLPCHIQLTSQRNRNPTVSVSLAVWAELDWMVRTVQLSLMRQSLYYSLRALLVFLHFDFDLCGISPFAMLPFCNFVFLFLRGNHLCCGLASNWLTEWLTDSMVTGMPLTGTDCNIMQKWLSGPFIFIYSI